MSYGRRIGNVVKLDRERFSVKLARRRWRAHVYFVIRRSMSLLSRATHTRVCSAINVAEKMVAYVLFVRVDGLDCRWRRNVED